MLRVGHRGLCRVQEARAGSSSCFWEGAHHLLQLQVAVPIGVLSVEVPAASSDPLDEAGGSVSQAPPLGPQLPMNPDDSQGFLAWESGPLITGGPLLDPAPPRGRDPVREHKAPNASRACSRQAEKDPAQGAGHFLRA